MRWLPIPPQIVRIILLTLGIAVAYLAARRVLTPASFGKYAWYRGDALEEIASRQPVFAGKKACDECHSELLQKVSRFEHKTISCETCHGVSREHVDNPEIKLAKFTDAQCVRCHLVEPAKPKWYKQIEPKKHYTGQRCIECHLPHQPNEVP